MGIPVGHIKGHNDADLHLESGEHGVPAVAERHSEGLGYAVVRGRDVETREARLVALKGHIEAHQAEGPRWRVMKGDELVGTAQQWGGETKASLDNGEPGGEYRSIIDRANPTGVDDFLEVAFGDAYDSRGGYTTRELGDTGIGKVWAIPAPYMHGTGQKEVDTGIRVIDAWWHNEQ